MTTATEGGRSCHVLSLDAGTGAILWDKHVFDQETLFKRKQNSYASPTPVTDGELVYAVFGQGGIVALDFDGKVVWENRGFDFFSEHGLGASPILYKNLLIMTFDPSSRTHREEKVGWKVPWDGAAIWALDKKTAPNDPGTKGPDGKKLSELEVYTTRPDTLFGETFVPRLHRVFERGSGGLGLEVGARGRLDDQRHPELFSKLKEWELYDPSLIVFMSDHGEGLGDHDYQEHGLLVVVIPTRPRSPTPTLFWRSSSRN